MNARSPLWVKPVRLAVSTTSLEYFRKRKSAGRSATPESEQSTLSRNTDSRLAKKTGRLSQSCTLTPLKLKEFAPNASSTAVNGEQVMSSIDGSKQRKGGIDPLALQQSLAFDRESEKQF